MATTCTHRTDPDLPQSPPLPPPPLLLLPTRKRRRRRCHSGTTQSTAGVAADAEAETEVGKLTKRRRRDVPAAPPAASATEPERYRSPCPPKSVDIAMPPPPPPPPPPSSPTAPVAFTCRRPAVCGCAPPVQAAPTGLLDLPVELLLHILSYVDARSRVRAARTCRYLGELATDHVSWATLAASPEGVAAALPPRPVGTSSGGPHALTDALASLRAHAPALCRFAVCQTFARCGVAAHWRGDLGPSDTPFLLNTYVPLTRRSVVGMNLGVFDTTSDTAAAPFNCGVLADAGAGPVRKDTALAEAVRLGKTCASALNTLNVAIRTWRRAPTGSSGGGGDGGGGASSSEHVDEPRILTPVVAWRPLYVRLLCAHTGVFYAVYLNDFSGAAYTDGKRNNLRNIVLSLVRAAVSVRAPPAALAPAADAVAAVDAAFANGRPDAGTFFVAVLFMRRAAAVAPAAAAAAAAELPGTNTATTTTSGSDAAISFQNARMDLTIERLVHDCRTLIGRAS